MISGKTTLYIANILIEKYLGKSDGYYYKYISNIAYHPKLTLIQQSDCSRELTINICYMY